MKQKPAKESIRTLGGLASRLRVNLPLNMEIANSVASGGAIGASLPLNLRNIYDISGGVIPNSQPLGFDVYKKLYQKYFVHGCSVKIKYNVTDDSPLNGTIAAGRKAISMACGLLRCDVATVLASIDTFQEVMDIASQAYKGAKNYYRSISRIGSAINASSTNKGFVQIGPKYFDLTKPPVGDLGSTTRKWPADGWADVADPNGPVAPAFIMPYQFSQREFHTADNKFTTAPIAATIIQIELIFDVEFADPALLKDTTEIGWFDTLGQEQQDPDFNLQQLQGSADDDSGFGATGPTVGPTGAHIITIA